MVFLTFLLFTLLCLHVALAQETLTCAGSNEELEKPKRQSKLIRCTQYFDSACCTPETEPKTAKENFELQDGNAASCTAANTPTDECLDMLTQLNCARYCAPEQGRLFTTGGSAGNHETGMIRICKSFADKLFEACGNGVPNGIGCSGSIKTQYQDGGAKAWVESQQSEWVGLRGVYVDDELRCFAGASSLIFSPLLLLAAAAALVVRNVA